MPASGAGLPVGGIPGAGRVCCGPGGPGGPGGGCRWFIGRRVRGSSVFDPGRDVAGTPAPRCGGVREC
ncbi:MAG TPA: hypothetical protein ENK11_07845 [Phycisphaerales bacterium]|nr:hypothetical protein [Phycisphaerales bacterium]